LEIIRIAPQQVNAWRRETDLLEHERRISSERRASHRGLEYSVAPIA